MDDAGAGDEDNSRVLRVVGGQPGEGDVEVDDLTADHSDRVADVFDGAASNDEGEALIEDRIVDRERRQAQRLPDAEFGVAEKVERQTLRCRELDLVLMVLCAESEHGRPDGQELGTASRYAQDWAVRPRAPGMRSQPWAARSPGTRYEAIRR